VLAGGRNPPAVPIEPGDMPADATLAVVDDFDVTIPVGAKELEAIETHLSALVGLEKLHGRCHIEHISIGTAPNACDDC
jgi:hypothetical protein